MIHARFPMLATAAALLALPIRAQQPPCDQADIACRQARACPDAATDFCYRPYPILLVHGFNSWPGSMGLETMKGHWGDVKPEKDERISNLVVGTLSDGMAPLLITLADGSPDYRRPIDKVPADMRPDRFIPHEEAVWEKKDGSGSIIDRFGNYSGLDHTYVEAFCYRYAWESNDGVYPFARSKFGVRRPDLPSDDSNPERMDDYDISKGGNTQLMRIRVIQILNEYYGDFRWLGDPTAKIRIICHSNGGLIASNMLKSEDMNPDYWLNGGKNLAGVSLSQANAIKAAGGGFRIDGFGTLLKDHVAQVITFDSPLLGSPLAETDGSISNFLHERLQDLLVDPFSNIFYRRIQLESNSTLRFVEDAFTKIVSHHLTEFLSEQMLSYIANGPDSPVFYDFAQKSNFVKNLTGDGKAPRYSNGKQIPYVNINGRLTELADVLVAFSYVLKGAMAIGVIELKPDYVSALNDFLDGVEEWADWARKSDFIVPIENQDVKNIWTDSERKIIHINGNISNAMHIYVQKSVNAGLLPPLLDTATTVEITHAVGLLQSKDGDPDFKVVLPNGKMQFTGMIADRLPGDLDQLTSRKWPAIKDGSIEMNIKTGKTRHLVGKLGGGYLGKRKVLTRVNMNEWRVADTYEEVMKHAGRHVDEDGDGKVDPATDFTLGSWVFLPTTQLANPDVSLINDGENLVQVRVIDDQTNEIVHTRAIVRYGTNTTTAFQVDQDGKVVEKTPFFQKPMRWQPGEIKTVYVGFNIRVDEGYTMFRTRSDAGDANTPPIFELTRFNPVGGGSPGPGQFQFVELPLQKDRFSSTLNMAKIVMDDRVLEKLPDGRIAPQQYFHSRLKTSVPSGQVANESETFLSMIIDNEAPTVTMIAPASPLAGCSANPPSSATECDGLDNDFDGLVDLDDKSEASAILLYSPKFDDKGKADPKSFVNISFRFQDASKEFYPVGGELKWEIYKVPSNRTAWAPGEGTLVHTRPLGREPDLNTDYYFNWNFEGLAEKLVPAARDGLYAVVVTGSDAAGNETRGEPSYFIIDTKSPVVKVVQGWQSNEGTANILNGKALYMNARFLPDDGKEVDGKFTDRTGSGGQRISASFIPVDLAGRPTDGTRVVREAGFNYQDNLTEGTPIQADPDGKVDPSSISVSGDSRLSNLPDGRYSVVVTATDRAGNIASVPELNKTVIIDRAAPLFRNSAATPSLLSAPSQTLRITGELMETDPEVNRLVSASGSFAVSVRIDDPAANPSLQLSLPAIAGATALPATASLTVPAALSEGQHRLHVTVTDARGNSSVTVVPFWIRNFGIAVISPPGDVPVKGLVSVTGNVSDPDEGNDAPFDRYELRLKNAQGVLQPASLLTAAGSTDNFSRVKVGNNGLIGRIDATSLPSGSYTLELLVYEAGISQPSIHTHAIKVDQGLDGTSDNPSLSATVPPFYDDPAALFTYSYNLGQRVSDVTTRIVNSATREVVFEARHAGVIPFEGAPAGADEIVGGRVKIWRAGGTWNFRWNSGAPMELDFILPGLNLVPGDFVFDPAAVRVTVFSGNRISALTVSGASCPEGGCRLTFSASRIASVDAFQVNVPSGTGLLGPSAIEVGAAGLHPDANPFFIRNRMQFSWDGLTMLRNSVDNGSYRVEMSAQATNGIGYAEIVPATVSVTNRPEYALALRDNPLPAVVLKQDGTVARPATLFINVNKVSDLFLSVVQSDGGNEMVLKEEVLRGVIAGKAPAGDIPYQWDGNVLGKLPSALPGIKYSFKVRAVRVDGGTAPPGGAIERSVDIGIQKAEFAVLPGNADPLLLAGGVESRLTASGHNFQVVSGDARAHVRTDFKGDYFKPIHLAYDLEIRSAQVLTLNNRLDLISYIDRERYIQIAPRFIQERNSPLNASPQTYNDVLMGNLRFKEGAHGWTLQEFDDIDCGGSRNPSTETPCLRLGVKKDGLHNFTRAMLQLSQHSGAGNNPFPPLAFMSPDRLVLRYVPDFRLLINQSDKRLRSGFWSLDYQSSGGKSWVEGDATVKGRLKFYPVFTLRKPDYVDALVPLTQDVEQTLSWLESTDPAFEPLPAQMKVKEQHIEPEADAYSHLLFFPAGGHEAWENEFRQEAGNVLEYAPGFDADDFGFQASYSVIHGPSGGGAGVHLRVSPSLALEDGVTELELQPKEIELYTFNQSGLSRSTQDIHFSWDLYSDDKKPVGEKTFPGFDVTGARYRLHAFRQGSTDDLRFVLSGPAAPIASRTVAGGVLDPFLLDLSSADGRYAERNVEVAGPGGDAEVLNVIPKLCADPAVPSTCSYVEGLVHVERVPNTLVFKFSIDQTRARSLGLIASWDPAVDPALDPSLPGGELVSTVNPTGIFDKWAPQTYMHDYPALAGGTAPLFTGTAGAVTRNPNLFISQISSRVTYFGGQAANQNLSAKDNLTQQGGEIVFPGGGQDYRHYENACVGINLIPSGPENNYVRLSFASPLDLTGYSHVDVLAYQNGRRIAIAENLPAGNPPPALYWNSGTLGGEVSLQVVLRGGNGGDRTYEQTSYIGHVISAPADGNPVDNLVAYSPYNRAALQYQAGALPFDEPVVSSIFPVKLSDLFLSGLKPLSGVDGNSPAVAVTPAPFSFTSAQRPEVAYRYLRSEIVEGANLKISRGSLAKMYMIDPQSGAITDVTTTMSAINEAGQVVFEADANMDANMLVNNWKYWEIRGLPSVFKDVAVMHDANTLVDQVVLDPGHTSRAQALAIRGSFKPFDRSGGGQVQNPFSGGYRILANFNQGLEDLSLESALGHPNPDFPNTTLDVPVTIGNDYSERAFTQSIPIPAGLPNNSSVHVYGFPTGSCEDTEGNAGDCSAGVSFARFVHKTTALGVVVVADNSYVNKANPTGGQLTITPLETGTMSVVWYDEKGNIERTQDYDIRTLDPFQIGFGGLNPAGLPRLDGEYKYQINFKDDIGNAYEGGLAGHFVVDREEPTIKTASARITDYAGLVYTLKASLSDNLGLKSARADLLSKDGSILGYAAFSLSGGRDEVNWSIQAERPWEHPDLFIRLEVQDEAGNSASKEIQVPVVNYEDFPQKWVHRKDISVRLIPLSEHMEDFPVLIRLDASNFDFSQARQDGLDLRFTDASGNPLFSEIEAWDPAGKTAATWVRLPEVSGPLGLANLRMHWGNPAAVDLKSMSRGTWNRGFVTVHHMIGDGAVFKDATAVAWDAANHGVSLVPGLIGKAGLFEAGDFLEAVDSRDVFLGGQATVSAWVKRSRTQVRESLVSFQGGAMGWSLGVDDAGLLEFNLGAESAHTAHGIPASAWTYVAVTYDGAVLRLFLDGELETEVPMTALLANQALRYLVGKLPTGSPFLGQLDELTYSDVARSADWIRLCFLTQRLGQRTVQVPPTAVAGLQGSVNGQGGVTLTWNPFAAGSDNILVDRKVGGGAWEQVIVLQPGSTEYADNAVECGVTVVYRVVAQFGEARSEGAELAIVTKACGFLIRNARAEYPMLQQSASNTVRMRGIHTPFVHGSTSNPEFILNLR